MTVFIESQAAKHAASGATAADAQMRAVSDFCQVVFCLNEFIFID
jgi:hypothetical protein